MSKKKKPAGGRGRDFVADVRRERAEREKGYRERALKILPWICASCGREFTGKNLRQLTVHHKDHDHTNNPADGSNWELLCIYCHDAEHSRHEVAESYDGAGQGKKKEGSGFLPLAGLEDLLKKEE